MPSGSSLRRAGDWELSDRPVERMKIAQAVRKSSLFPPMAPALSIMLRWRAQRRKQAWTRSQYWRVAASIVRF